MEPNALPFYDQSVNTTGCCAKFDPDGWDGQTLHFRDKRFLRATTRSKNHMPLDMDKVFTRVHAHIEAAGGYDPKDIIVLSRDLSADKGEHLFSVPGAVPDEEMTTLTGDFVTKVFEGPYSDAKDWNDQMEALAKPRGKDPARIYFFYTTCPTCAEAYGKNYVVGLAEV